MNRPLDQAKDDYLEHVRRYLAVHKLNDAIKYHAMQLMERGYRADSAAYMIRQWLKGLCE